MNRSRLRRAAAAALLAVMAAVPTMAFTEAEQYVAMGDSYASGVGAGDYDGSDCSRSSNAYGPLLAERLGAELVFPACGGATIPTVYSGQMDSLSPEADLVTISVGGNDVGFSDIISTCTFSSDATCFERIEEAEADGRDRVAGELADLYADIAAAAPNADTVVVGYPHLFHEQACFSAFGISAAEQERLNEGVDTINAITAEVAAAQGFTFADPVDDFAGHGICSWTPWIKGLDFDGAYHPNASGQASGYLPAVEGAL
ncbi:SGNH/GDSL hydrolase family protein [Salininema proteolyticum]|uniref:SGNH/GDSL hydrolase family protein n=1 Tax=Salininema proteolyticum TaxID=1607685 RepID=A0ABV8U4S4_9ACTN